jgi:hypothetical protein
MTTMEPGHWPAMSIPFSTVQLQSLDHRRFEDNVTGQSILLRLSLAYDQSWFTFRVRNILRHITRYQ